MIYTKFLESVYFLLGKFTKYNAWKYYKELMKNQWLPYKELKKIQWEKLIHLLKHAYQNIPFYTRKFQNAGISPEDIKKSKDLALLPVTTREELMAGSFNEVTARNFSRQNIDVIHTSGTTGRPFRLYIDFNTYNYKYALHLWGYSFKGWRLGNKIASLWQKKYYGYQGKYDQQKGAREPYQRLRNLIYPVIHRQILLPPLTEGSNLDYNKGMAYINRLSRHRPWIFESFTSYIAILSNFIQENDLKPPEVKTIDALGVLSREDRKKTGEIWGAEVFNRFGPHEMEGIAHECNEHKGLHISINSYFVEFNDLDTGASVPNGEIGELIITDLNNYAMPLIRYRIGDVARKLSIKCPCGRGLPLMSDLEGRAQNCLTSAKGGELTELFFVRFFFQFKEIKYFQLIEKKNKSVEVHIVKKDGMNNMFLEKIRTGLFNCLGKNTNISIRLVSSITMEKNGKFAVIKKR